MLSQEVVAHGTQLAHVASFIEHVGSQLDAVTHKFGFSLRSPPYLPELEDRQKRRRDLEREPGSLPGWGSSGRDGPKQERPHDGPGTGGGDRVLFFWSSGRDPETTGTTRGRPAAPCSPQLSSFCSGNEKIQEVSGAPDAVGAPAFRSLRDFSHNSMNYRLGMHGLFLFVFFPAIRRTFARNGRGTP
ncbi:hypothetical protein L209DRAFT_64749 [Thermothelomyces heterothallicus CBS 203.75]